MLLRSGRTIGDGDTPKKEDVSVRVEDHLIPRESGSYRLKIIHVNINVEEEPEASNSDDDYFDRQGDYLEESSKIIKTIKNNKNPSFLDYAIYYGKFFQYMYDNIDIVKDPRFAIKDAYKKLTLDKVEEWNKRLPKWLTNFILKNDVKDYQLLHSTVKNTHKIVNMVKTAFLE